MIPLDRYCVLHLACQEFSRTDIEDENAASEAKCEGAQLKVCMHRL